MTEALDLGDVDNDKVKLKVLFGHYWNLDKFWAEMCVWDSFCVNWTYHTAYRSEQVHDCVRPGFAVVSCYV